MVDELAAVVRVADGVRVPLDLEAFQLGAVLREADDDLVYVDACAHAQEPSAGRPAAKDPWVGAEQIID